MQNSEDPRQGGGGFPRGSASAATAGPIPLPCNSPFQEPHHSLIGTFRQHHHHSSFHTPAAPPLETNLTAKSENSKPMKSTLLKELRRVECHTCGKHYSSRKSLKIHMRIHTGYKPYKCTMCTKSFSQSNVLKAHVNAHNGTRDFSCQVCGRAFTQSAHMKTHERIHSKRKDHTCTFCHRSFGSKGVLIRHFRQHTGEKPYRCPRCPKTFTRAESLQSHENSHEGIRPHLCKYALCRSTFTKKSSRKRHEKTCHKDQPRYIDCTIRMEDDWSSGSSSPGGSFDNDLARQRPMTPMSPEVFNKCLQELLESRDSLDDLKFMPDSPATSTSTSDSGFLSQASSPGFGEFDFGHYELPLLEVKEEPVSPSAVAVPGYPDPWETALYFNNTPFNQQINAPSPATNQLPMGNCYPVSTYGLFSYPDPPNYDSCIGERLEQF